MTGNTTPLAVLRKELQALARLSADVGYLEATPVPDSSLTVPELATVLEYGNETIPERPFMRRAARAAEATLDDYAAKYIEAVVDGTTSPVRAMDAIADHVAGKVLEQLDTAASWATANDPDTIEAKGGDTPLYAGHGTLRDELRYAVVDAGTRILTEKPRG